MIGLWGQLNPAISMAAAYLLSIDELPEPAASKFPGPGLWRGAVATGGVGGRLTGPVITAAVEDRDAQTPGENGAIADPAGLHWLGVQISPGSQPSPPEANGLLLNFITVPASAEDEFNAWYNTEHLPRVSEVPGVLAARRFHSPAHRLQYLAAYHLDDPSVSRGDAWIKAAASPWTRRIQTLRTAGSRLLFSSTEIIL